MSWPYEGIDPRTQSSTAPFRHRHFWIVLAIAGAILGLVVLGANLGTGPLADVRAYYNAGARLNAGGPLYPAGADVNAAEFYRYPPLLAIVFRPIAALLPYGAAAVGWEAFCLLTFGLTLRRLGLGRLEVRVALGLLGIGIGWSLAIGQAQIPVTYLLVIGSPAAVALAANLKLLPLAVALYWIGRRDWRALGRLVSWLAGLAVIQLLLEPTGSLAFFGITNFTQVGGAELPNLSPYALSPALWAILAIGGGLAALRLAPTKAGWAAAVALSVLVSPRLLYYAFMTLLASLRREPAAGDAVIGRPGGPIALNRSGRGSPPKGELRA